MTSQSELRELSEEEFSQILSLLTDPVILDEQNRQLDQDMEKVMADLKIKEETTEEKIASLKKPKGGATKSADALFDVGQSMARDIISLNQQSLENITKSKIANLE